MSTQWLDVQLWALLAGIVIPLLVGVVTKLAAPSWLKAIINLGLAAISAAVITMSNTGGHVASWKLFFEAIGMTWWTSVASYYGFYRPTAVTQKVQLKTAKFGVGPRTA